MTSESLRQAFIDFFIAREHSEVKASPVVPQNDPSILFTNAGMNQFKDIFLDTGTRPYTRAVNSQTCIRVSGKHNDLDEVGRDTYHHTLFEMLGNWSFGDYYKEDAIHWAWAFLTEELGIDKTTLYASIYDTDDEAEELWKTKTDIDHSHILRFGKKENFWEMAETGPCGPCSEIHVDKGLDACDKKEIAGHSCAVNGDCARYIELWNLVFIQYNRQKDGRLEELPKKHVDTGMGLERILAHINKKDSNYDTDLFRPIISHIDTLSGVAYEDGEAGTAHRVIADHIRTLTIAIADNVRPSNEGRGYVLRRILRRALRFAQSLGLTEPCLYKLVSTVSNKMGEHFDHIPAQLNTIERIIKAEEESFLNTLESGTTEFKKIASEMKKSNKKQLSGKHAFTLYDTYGFPIDLTEIMAEEQGFSVDHDGFVQLLNQQKELSREAGKAEKNQDTEKESTEQIPVSEQQINTIHKGVYTDVAGGGEALIPRTEKERFLLARHHSGTHVLHAALHEVLGSHITQAGSLVEAHRLRFDFSHFQALSEDELKKIQAHMDRLIREAIPIETCEKDLEDAKAMGAIATFGEKYEDRVRIVSIGDYSMELCGGNHVGNTKDLEAILITSESAIATGTRRIEALVGQENIAAYLNKKNEKKSQLLSKKKQQLSTLIEDIQSLNSDSEALASLNALLETEDESTLLQGIKTAEKQLSLLKTQEASSQIDDIEAEIQAITNGQFLAITLANYDIKMLRSLSDNLANRHENLIQILCGQNPEKSLLLIKVSDSLSETHPANTLLQKITEHTGGSGGGKDKMAQAGGIDPSLFDQAIEQLKNTL